MRRGARHDLLAQARVGATVAEQFGFDRDELAVLLRAGFDADDRRVPLRVEQQAFLARVQHLYGALGPFGEQGGVDLRRRILLAAEPAAHQRRHDAYVFVLDRE